MSIYLKWRHNHRMNTLDCRSGGSVGVLRRDGCVRYMHWGGFRYRDEIRYMQKVQRVKLVIEVVADSVLVNFEKDNLLPNGSYIEGVIINNSAYAVIDETVRIVEGVERLN